MSENSSNWEALHNAVDKKNVPEIERLLSLGADVDVRDDRNATSLQRAIRSSHNFECFGTIEVLLKNGADTEVQNENGRTILNQLARQAFVHLKLYQLLLDYNADVYSKDHKNRIPLINAIRGCNLEAVRLLFAYNPDIESVTTNIYP